MTKKHHFYQGYAQNKKKIERPKVLKYEKRKQWPYYVEKIQDCITSREYNLDILILELQVDQEDNTLYMGNIHNLLC